MLTVQTIIFGLLFMALILALLPPRTLSFTQNILREKRESIRGRMLPLHQKLIAHVYAATQGAGITTRTFLLMTVAAFVAGTGVGYILFNGTTLGIATGTACLPVPYIYLLLKGQHIAQKELESLENTMSVITNAYVGCNDIVEAFYSYTREQNLHRNPNQTTATPFDAFVTEVMLINPDVERGLYILETKINNYHFSEWVKMLQMCTTNSNLKFALPPIITAMGDAKAMQIESDTQMSQVWRDYIMTVCLMFGIIPILRFANADWYAILTTTLIGKLLIGLMLVMALISAFIVTRITQPVGTHLGRAS